MTYTDPSKRKLRYRYDAHGRLCELVNGNGASYRFDYDAGDRLSKEIRVDGIEEHFKYDTAGSLVESEKVGKDDAGAERRRKALFIRDAKGNLLERRTETAITSYQYDPLDRAVSIQRLPTEAGAALGVGHDELRFEYDLAGMLVAEHGANGSIEYKHDELGNVTKVGLPFGKQEIETFYYGSGHALHIKVGDQVITEFERDDLHREILRTQGKLTNRFKYDPKGRLLSQAATSREQKGVWRDYRYNGVGELLESRDSLRWRTIHTYDSAGHAQQTLGTDKEHFLWDAAGNLLDESSPHEPLKDNRLRRWGDLRLSYDAFGNLDGKIKGHHEQQRFEYDADDRLVTVRARTSNGGSETRFAYDAIGRRIAKSHVYVPYNPREPEVRTERRFVWEGLRLVQEADSRSISTYVYDPTATYTPLARVDQSFAQDGTAWPAKVYYFHTDPVGTPLEVTDAHGGLVWAGKYKTWGTVEGSLTKLKMDRIEQNLRFPGQYQDTETGLYYNTFRYYDPEVGRFTTQDPIGLAGGENLYGYGPNTTGSIDPLGWCANTKVTRGNKGRPAIVLGENMDRITQAAGDLRAKGVDARWYRAWKKNFPPRGQRLTPSQLDAALARNARWLRDKIAKEYKLYDIGRQLGRKGGPSPFYSMEKNIVEEIGYLTTFLPGY